MGRRGGKPAAPCTQGTRRGGGHTSRTWCFTRRDSMVTQSMGSSEFACGWTLPIPANVESLQDPWLLDKANPTHLGQCAINRSDMSLPDQST